MKKMFILGLVIVFSMSLFAQTDVVNVNKTPILTKTIAQKPNQKVVLHFADDAKSIPVGVPIGRTNYDLQSNSCVAKRMIVHADGTISAVWLEDQSDAPGGSTRGTGYAFYDGTSWQYVSGLGSDANSHIDAVRTGWPALMSDGTKEFVANHQSTAPGLFGWSQNKGAAGTGWSQNDITGGPEAMLWPRAASAGNNFYVIAVDDYTTSQAEIDALHFYKSDDAGATWTYKGEIPDFSTYYAYGNGDQYAIDAYDSIVAIVYFSGFGDTRLWKSTDYGETWITKAIVDFPMDAYDGTAGNLIDMDSDGQADTLYSSDDMGDVIIDHDGMVHCVFGRMRILDEDPADDGASSYFPYTDYLLYWNEDMGEGVWDGSTVGDNIFDMAVSPLVDTVGYSFDLDGNNVIWEFVDAGTEIPFGIYYCSITSMGSLGIDNDGNIYCAFTTVMEGDNYAKTDATPNPQSFRGAWLRVRDTNGVWLDPVCVSDIDGTNAENVFPTLARNVDGVAHLWVQWDNEPGLYIRGDEDPNVTDNYIIYKSIPVDTLGIVPSSVVSVYQHNELKAYPNPVTNLLTVEVQAGSTIQIYSILGALVQTVVATDNTTVIDMANLPAGTYVIKATTDNDIATTKILKIK
ncbi:MAG: T9SS type A sorting domain-containing protein [Bacteroidales bacterium]|nr:T9SS type A sorting domain-containing protein [Bacteroidales bacterium]